MLLSIAHFSSSEAKRVVSKGHKDRADSAGNVCKVDPMPKERRYVERIKLLNLTFKHIPL